MKFTTRILPKSLKAVLKKADVNISQQLVVAPLDGKLAVKIIDEKFAQSMPYTMPGRTDEQKKNIYTLIANKGSEYEDLVNQIGSQTFGDNIGNYQKIYPNDKDEGSWELAIVDLEFDGRWVNIEVFLKPVGFELTE